MRYGKTHNEWFEEWEKQGKTPIIKDWRKRFALFPVRVNDGSRVWLETYLIRDRWVAVPKGGLYPGFWVVDKKAIKLCVVISVTLI